MECLSFWTSNCCKDTHWSQRRVWQPSQFPGQQGWQLPCEHTLRMADTGTGCGHAAWTAPRQLAGNEGTEGKPTGPTAVGGKDQRLGDINGQQLWGVCWPQSDPGWARPLLISNMGNMVWKLKQLFFLAPRFSGKCPSAPHTHQVCHTGTQRGEEWNLVFSMSLRAVAFQPQCQWPQACLHKP